MKDDLLKGSLMALPTNVRLVWKGLSGTNTLAYYGTRKLWTKMFYNKVTNFTSKLECFHLVTLSCLV